MEKFLINRYYNLRKNFTKSYIELYIKGDLHIQTS